MILHHIQESPACSPGLKLALRYMGVDDALILSGDAVSSVLQNAWQEAIGKRRLYLLSDDVVARGLKHKISTVTLDCHMVGYREWVSLTLVYDKVITW